MLIHIYHNIDKVTRPCSHSWSRTEACFLMDTLLAPPPSDVCLAHWSLFMCVSKRLPKLYLIYKYILYKYNIHAYIYTCIWAYTHTHTHIHTQKYKEYIERVYKWKHPTIYTLDYFHLIISLRKINNNLQNLAFLYTLAYGFLF